MPTNAAPQPGDRYLSFDGDNDCVEIRSLPAYSVDHTGTLTVAAWLRADIDNFRKPEKGTDYVHWLGKGEGSGVDGAQEWVCRMYSKDTPHELPPRRPRTKRTSFYVFNPEGGWGVGSYIQPSTPVAVNEWRLIVGMADQTRTYLYCNGECADCDIYQGEITPVCGLAPLRIGTQDKKSFFQGGIAKVRIWNRLLTDGEIRELYLSDSAPRDLLAAEFLLGEGAGKIAKDTAKYPADGNDGKIDGATWATQT